jgi:hypothetical protein
MNRHASWNNHNRTREREREITMSIRSEEATITIFQCLIVQLFFSIFLSQV